MNKKEALYVKACVIQNGVTDVQGDTLYREDIKRIFTSYNNNNSFEVNHDGIPIEGVSLLENYISSNDEQIGGTIVPSGSWLIVMKVTCPTIQSQILSGVYGGVSLSNRVKSECNCQLTGTIRYKDLSSTECVIPVYISLVDAGANGVGLEVFDYDSYILKSKGCERLNIIESLKSLIQEAESQQTDDVVINKSSEAVVEEATNTTEEEPVNNDESDVSDDEPVINKSADDAPAIEEDEEKEEDDDTEVIEKECESKEEDEKVIEKSESEEAVEESEDDDEIKKLDERISKLEELIKQLAQPQKEEDEANIEKSEDTPVITKSAKVVITEDKETTPDYYTLSGRDPITGIKIQK